MMAAKRSDATERGSRFLRLLDRYAGIPVVSTLGLLRAKRASPPSEIRSIGMLRTVAIGDTILMAGPLADLRAAFPNARITLFVGADNYEAARLLEGASTVVRLPMRRLARACKLVRQHPVDVMVDFGQWPRANALLALAARASFTIGFRTASQYRHYGYDIAIDHSDQVHELENFRKLLEPLGIVGSRVPAITPQPFVSDCGRPSRDFLVFHLWPGGSRADLKIWPIERWERLVRHFTAIGYDVVLTGGAADRERNETLVLSSPVPATGKVFNFAGWPLARAATLMSRARLVVSVNTGMMHVAAALRVPLVALHGPTSSRRWGPVSDRAIAIQSPLPGSGYLNLGWETPPSPPPCMEAISYESVKRVCLMLLEGGIAPRPIAASGTSIQAMEDSV